MKIRDIITESKSRPVIVVDVQPTYCGNSPVCKDIIDFVAKQRAPVLMFVNAEDQGLTEDTVHEIQMWWEDVADDEIDWQRFKIDDKGYGYFRTWMDQGISPSVIISVIRRLYQERLTDSRDLFGGDDSEQYQQGIQELAGAEYQDWMLDDPIIVGWTSVAQLKQFSGALLVGGARNECLREVELLMNAFNIKYKRVDSLVYG